MEDDRPPEWRNPNPQPEGLTFLFSTWLWPAGARAAPAGLVLEVRHVRRSFGRLEHTSGRARASWGIIVPRGPATARRHVVDARGGGASPRALASDARRRPFPPRPRLGVPPVTRRVAARRSLTLTFAPSPPSPPQTCLATALALAAFVFLEELSVFRDRVQALILAGARGGLTRASTDAGVVRTTARWSSTSHEWIRRAPGADDDAPPLLPPAGGDGDGDARARFEREVIRRGGRPTAPAPPAPPAAPLGRGRGRGSASSAPLLLRRGGRLRRRAIRRRVRVVPRILLRRVTRSRGGADARRAFPRVPARVSPRRVV